MKKVNLISKLIFLIITLTTLSYADVPKLINYQGHLTDKEGNPLTGTYSIIFTIYDDATAGSSQWTETQSSVEVKNGLFSVLLGSVVVLPESVFDSPDRWLSVAIAGDSEVSPRQQLVSVPYAYKAGQADGMLGYSKVIIFHMPMHNWTATDPSVYSGSYGFMDSKPSKDNLPTLADEIEKWHVIYLYCCYNYWFKVMDKLCTFKKTDEFNTLTFEGEYSAKTGSSTWTGKFKFSIDGNDSDEISAGIDYAGVTDQPFSTTIDVSGLTNGSYYNIEIYTSGQNLGQANIVITELKITGD